MSTYNLREGIPEKYITGDILNCPYRLDGASYGGKVELVLPKGIYRFEAWGCAAGTVYENETWRGSDYDGTGGYAGGTLTLTASTRVFLRPGGVADNGGKGKYVDYEYRSYTYGSGGASDVRLIRDSNYNRVLVAGGGGQSGWGTGSEQFPAGHGGGESGTPSGYAAVNGGGGGPTSGGQNGSGYTYSNQNYMNASFGQGGYTYSGYGLIGASGGGGWYGGGCGGFSRSGGTEYNYGAGGGSGFALSAGTAGNAPAGYALGSAYYLTDTVNKTGHEAGDPITEPDGTTHAGHWGEGYIRITVIQGQLETPVVTDISEPTEGSLRIAWGTVSGATGYDVYDGNGSLLARLASSPYSETGITPDTEYVRKIVATSEAYASSDPADVTYLSKLKLAPPQNLRLRYTVNTTVANWSAVSGAQNYAVSKDGTYEMTVTLPTYTDAGGGEGTIYTYTVVAQASGRWDSDPTSITSDNNGQLDNVTGLRSQQTVNSVTLNWNAAANATSYDVLRDGVLLGNTDGLAFTDGTTKPGTTYRYTVRSKARSYYDSTGAELTVNVNPQLDKPDLIESGQTQTTASLSWALRDYGASVTYALRRDGRLIYRGSSLRFTDTGLVSGETYTYSLVASIPGSGYYDSPAARLKVKIGRSMTPSERLTAYMKTLRGPFVKLCRLRFLNPNGTTAYALDNNPKNRRSRAFIASGSVTANLQNGQRYSASVTLHNADGDYETSVNKVWFGQEVALDEGLVLPNGEEYYRQTGVFYIDNPSEKIDSRTRTVTYRLLDKWSVLDGTLGGNLEGTYEVPIGTNIFEPISSLLSEDRGNGQEIDREKPVYTEYYNGMTQELPDGTTASMTDSPYTLTVSGDGGTIGQVILGLGAMVNAWVGYDNTGRLRIDPSQDDILDADKPVLWRFSEEETQLLGMAYNVKKEEVFNDYIVVGEQLDDYEQPGGRATNLDPRSDTNVYLIGRKTKRESASGYATVQQCTDLAEWRLKRSSVLQRAVSISCSQMFHIDLNSLVEIVRTDKPGSPVERHLIQGFTRPLAYSGAMTISAVSVVDLPMATVSRWPE